MMAISKRSCSFILLLFLAGCSTSALPALDHDQARAAVRAGLDAWKGGDTPTALKARTPSIVLVDYAWNQGQRLVNYRIHDAERDDGVNLYLQVDLTLAQKGQAESKQRVTYVVGTNPVITVVRE